MEKNWERFAKVFGDMLMISDGPLYPTSSSFKNSNNHPTPSITCPDMTQKKQQQGSLVCNWTPVAAASQLQPMIHPSINNYLIHKPLWYLQFGMNCNRWRDIASGCTGFIRHMSHPFDSEFAHSKTKEKHNSQQSVIDCLPPANASTRNQVGRYIHRRRTPCNGEIWKPNTIHYPWKGFVNLSFHFKVFLKFGCQQTRQHCASCWVINRFPRRLWSHVQTVPRFPPCDGEKWRQTLPLELNI